MIMPASPKDRIAIVIPARLSSTRLPRKMLLAETGRPLIEHTWRSASRSGLAGRVIVATDSEEIAEAVRGFGGEAVMTSPDAPSGTARICEMLDRIPDAEMIVNVQGDEPEIDPDAIDLAVGLLGRCEDAGMATLVTPLKSRDDLADPACVKAVLTPWRAAGGASDTSEGRPVEAAWRAITFSRAPVPFAREWRDELLASEPPLYWQHVGLYAYRRDLLERWESLPESRLAAVESLEQLRAVEAGIGIVAGAVASHARGIDTPKDYASFVARVATAPARAGRLNSSA